MRHDQSLQHHYHLLLGLNQDWEVTGVKLSMEARAVHIRLTHKAGVEVSCPGCQSRCSIFDHAPERKWRHLDTMQFATALRARVPRCKCEQCGVKTLEVPWAGKHSPFTWMFEAFGVAVVDRVRKDEHKRLMGEGNNTLKGSKYQWLHTHADKRSSEAVSFRKLHELDLKTSRAWHYKEDFRHFWKTTTTPELRSGSTRAGAKQS